jgi:hypothetical protein
MQFQGMHALTMQGIKTAKNIRSRCSIGGSEKNKSEDKELVLSQCMPFLVGFVLAGNKRGRMHMSALKRKPNRLWPSSAGKSNSCGNMRPKSASCWQKKEENKHNKCPSWIK